jgi:hypothetical protein
LKKIICAKQENFDEKEITVQEIFSGAAEISVLSWRDYSSYKPK